MSTPGCEITADTCCPALYGGPAHYPQRHSAHPVTMPGPDGAAYRPNLVLLSLCQTAYLLPPRDETATTPRRMCRDCRRWRMIACGEVVELGAAA